MRILCVLACVVFGCVSSDPDLTSAEEQPVWDGSGEDPDGEVVVVEGGWDACWDAGLCWYGTDGDHPQDPGDTGGYGGGGGGGGGRPPIPARKDCSELLADYEACTGCCDWNLYFVDAPTCNRKPTRTERGACWRTAMNITYPACLLMCHRARGPGILTGEGGS